MVGGRPIALLVDEALTSQGRFESFLDGSMRVLIGASLDPKATVRHEAIHALRTMGLFTEPEWRDLSRAAGMDRIEKHRIESRYDFHEDGTPYTREGHARGRSRRPSPRSSRLGPRRASR